LDKKTGDSESPNPAVTRYTTTVHVDSINGGVVNIGAIGGPAPLSSESAAGWCAEDCHRDEVQQPGDRLPALLSELGQKIRVLAPREKQPLAREQVASLERALTGARIDPAALAEAWDWFQSELPSLSGATLSVIREARPLAEREGERTLDEYHLLFGKL
jgi:hypothetical protein